MVGYRALCNWHFRLADLDPLRAPRGEGAPCRPFPYAQGRAGKAFEAKGAGQIWHRFHEPDRVRVDRVPEDLLDRALLDDTPRVHHRDDVSHGRDRRDVVRYIDNRRAHLVSQPEDLRQQPRLGHDVKPCGGFVQDDEWWVANDCHRYHDPLLLTAGQLVWKAAEDLVTGLELSALQRASHKSVAVSPRAMADPVLDLPSDATTGIEGCGRVLRHIRHEPPPQSSHLFLASTLQLDAAN